MSLLLEARKKAQLSQGESGDPSATGLSTEPHPGAEDAEAPPAALSSNFGGRLSGERARTAGKNLFSAKLSPDQAGIHRSLLLALGVAAMLFAAGAGYVWYIGSGGTETAKPPAPALIAAPVTSAPAAPPSAPPPAAAEKLSAAGSSEVTPAKAAKKTKRPARTVRKPARTQVAQPRDSTSFRIERRETESLDLLLNRAYLAYREGKFDLAEQLYRDALRLDERNKDTLLGLAAIAQRRGADSMAAHYYAKVLELDPRDAVANAGMSAITTDENRESRLKILLNEQQDSPPLHFALGNYYAAQERWGEAQQEYFNAFKLDQQNATLAFNLAVSLERIGQHGLAAQYYGKALQLDASRSAGFDHAQISGRIDELTR